LQGFGSRAAGICSSCRLRTEGWRVLETAGAGVRLKKAKRETRRNRSARVDRSAPNRRRRFAAQPKYRDLERLPTEAVFCSLLVPAQL